MKSTREPFDDELKDRLLQYTEEPDGDLWKRIAPHIVSIRPEIAWVVWSQRFSAIILGGLIAVQVMQREDRTESDRPIPIRSEEVQRENRAENGNHESNANVFAEDHSSDHATDSNGSEAITVGTTGLDSSPGAVEDNNEMVESMDVLSAGSALQVEPNDIIIKDTTIILSGKEAEYDTIRKKEDQNRGDKGRSLRRRAYRIYLTAMPTLGYQRIESNKSDDIYIESIHHVGTFSHKRLGFRVELGIEYPLTKRLRVFGGLLYYQRKLTIEYTEKQTDSTVVSLGPTGTAIIEPQFTYQERSVDYNLNNAGVQVGFNYKLSKFKSAYNSGKALSSETIPLPKKRFLHMLGLGIELQKALNKTDAFDQASGFRSQSAYVFLNAYYRLQYPSEGRVRAILQPTLNYSFYTNENLNAPFYVKPYGLGLNLGCTFDF
jgi:hypothetical protein